ncbi:hypothetical protein LOC67_05780 [Stieleria sp. JC731]|uniref:hypothetical protein n=1 Tax=Pirellulaceae TaxID=2691357 RepID=UPI001E564A08|nr:hypothetical protein [Stieleria sp. JC731]MCC9600063.1 hypothetical protein [Stieleria sp. JC731]
MVTATTSNAADRGDPTESPGSESEQVTPQHTSQEINQTAPLQSNNPITANQIIGRMLQVHTDLDAIADYMGRQRHSQSDFIARNVGPREIYFQSQVLFRIADRFAFDHTRKHLRSNPPSTASNQYSDVMMLVEATIDRINSVKQRYQISSPNLTVTSITEHSPEQLFESVVLANRKLNYLLDKRISPSEVFEQVTVGISYTSRLLEQTDSGQVMPLEPKFEPNKMPADVYAELLDCLEKIRNLAMKSGLQVLEIEPRNQRYIEIEPGDVLNLASLVVSELAYLHSRLPNALPPREVYSSGRKFPAHVFQRVGILKQQLEKIDQYSTAHPEWLGSIDSPSNQQ